MGEFTLNLLKLTEFPFSYSFIGLLALIYGQGINPQNLSYANIGPLLILVSFLATTLSICDPMGGIQRYIIRGKNYSNFFDKHKQEDIPYVSKHDKLFKYYKYFYQKFYGVPIGKGQDAISHIVHAKIFGRKIIRIFGPCYITAIYRSPEDFKKQNGGWINWPEKDTENASLGKDVSDVFYLLQGLKRQVVKTKWITAEVDKVTALIYFMVIISLFIVAIHVYAGFLSKFSSFFADVYLTRLLLFSLSALALLVVIYMFIMRIFGPDGLQSKALIVFKYLSALQAIKWNKEAFRPTLNDIERYLNEGHWTLAKYWVKRIEEDYLTAFSEQVNQK
jgi:hypothetical protein